MTVPVADGLLAGPPAVLPDGAPAAAPDGALAAGLDGVLFDIDDTLVDTRRAFAAALGAVARTHLPDLPTDRHRELVGAWAGDVAGHYARYVRGEISYEDQRMARANHLQAVFGGEELDEQGYAVWNDAFERAFSGAWAALPGASAVVDTLLGAGLRVGAVSNAGTAYQAGKLRATGLLDRVPMLVGVDTLGVGKPDLRVFAEGCRRLGADPARTAYVGDDLEVDAVPAVAAGLVGVWLDRPGMRRTVLGDVVVRDALAAGVLRVTSLDELPRLLTGA